MVWMGVSAAALCFAVRTFSVQRFWHDEVTLFTRCVEDAPTADFWHYRLGVTLQTRGDLIGARDQFETAVQLAPNYVAALYQLAHVDEAMGDLRGAERVTAERVKRYQHPPLAAYTDLAFAADAAGDEKGVAAALAQAAAMPGGIETAALTRAQLLVRHGDSKGAEQLLRDLLQQDPDDTGTLGNLGAVLLSEHRYAEALAIYQRAASISPPALLFHYQIALTLHQMGRDREARDECARVLAAVPDARPAQALMAEIERNAGSR